MNHNEIKAYREELRERIARIETIVERVESHLEKLNGRTSKLEDWRNWMIGGMACFGFIITLIKVGAM